MNAEDILIRSRVAAGLIEISGLAADAAMPSITDVNGNPVAAPVLKRDGDKAVLDGSKLQCWSPATPVLYFLTAGSSRVRFGYSELATVGNSQVTLNGDAIYLRGYIRGIVAHEHPNMTGGTLRDAAMKNIRQAKAYGFNLVRFHSTIPDENFVEAADELGLFIHMEIGFAYEYDEQGNKKNLALDNANWLDTILRYRNHPSAAVFCIGNEMHNSGHRPEVEKLYDIGRELAPHKLIMDNSGWGEYDRDSADIFSQHIAYYFPYKHHREMFAQDDCWHLNGSKFDAPMCGSNPYASFRRHATPLKPVLAHEAVHYIEIPDYDALNKKFDDFVAAAGPDYCARFGIKKPRYLTELPELIRRKGLTDRMPDYRRASENFKKFCLKTYLEELRHAPLCGFEMLQFADCLKYENKNGVVDCFDDDKYIGKPWMRAFTGDSVLLAEFADECFFSDETIPVGISLSHFGLPVQQQGTLTVRCECAGKGVELYRGENFVTVPGLQKLVELELAPEVVEDSAEYTLRARFETPSMTLENSWTFYRFARATADFTPRIAVENRDFAKSLGMIAQGPRDEKLVVTDRLDDALFAELAKGSTVLLCYDGRAPHDAPYYWPGTLDRFKPCIWDRGSNLGGIVRDDRVRAAMAGDRYFNAAWQPLCEAGYKINLDHFPTPVCEMVSGVDKPVRDRMKGMLHHIKDFQADDTLRNFCYLLAIRVGAGKLVVSTCAAVGAETPSGRSYFAAALEVARTVEVRESIVPDALKKYLTESRPVAEDVMNHFWEIDNKPVEDTLFWEQVQVDLSKIKES